MNVYDFDKTIYDGDSTADFYFYSIKKHPKALKHLPSLISGFFKYYVLQKGSKTEFKEKMYKFLLSCNAESDVIDFWTTHESKIKGWYKKQQQEDDLIISASPVFLLMPICKKLNIKHLIASEVNPKTGKYNGENCHGKEKVALFYKKFPNTKINEFYSDSYNDTPLAEIANKSYMVKGDIITNWEFKKVSVRK